MNFSNLTESALLELSNMLSDRNRISAAQRMRDERADKEAAAARDAAYDSLQQINAVVTQAEKHLAELVTDFEQAREAAERKRVLVGLAEYAKNQVVARQQAIFQSLAMVHGDGALRLAHIRLQNTIEAATKKLGGLREDSYIKRYAEDGISVVWQTFKPEVAVLVPVQEQLINALKVALKQVEELESVRGISPTTLRNKVATILEGVGLKADDLRAETPHH